MTPIRAIRVVQVAEAGPLLHGVTAHPKRPRSLGTRQILGVPRPIALVDERCHSVSERRIEGSDIVERSPELIINGSRAFREGHGSATLARSVKSVKAEIGLHLDDLAIDRPRWSMTTR